MSCVWALLIFASGYPLAAAALLLGAIVCAALGLAKRSRARTQQ